MRLLSVKDYVDFRCSGGDCPITCCGGGWEIIVDSDTIKKYESVEGELGDEIRANIEERKDGMCFKTNENGNCVLLDENGLCKIQKNVGEGYLCKTCKEYPRHLYHVGDITFCYLTNSCPEVNRMLMRKREPLQIIFDNSGKELDLLDEETRTKMDYAFSAFNVGIGILQNRSITITERLYLLLFFVDRFQQIMQEKGDPTNIIAVFSSPETYMLFLNNSNRPEFDVASKIHSFNIIFSAMMSVCSRYPIWSKGKELIEKIISNEEEIDINKLTELFKKTNSNELQVETEQILAYRFFVMFMRGFEKNDYFEKVAYECIIQASMRTYSVLSEMQFGEECGRFERILFYSFCSRIDHTANKDALQDRIRNEGYFTLEKLLKVIS